MRTASVIINLLIFSTTAALVVQCFRREGRWDPARGRAAFRYFTVLSNALCALAEACSYRAVQARRGKS